MDLLTKFKNTGETMAKKPTQKDLEAQIKALQEENENLKQSTGTDETSEALKALQEENAKLKVIAIGKGVSTGKIVPMIWKHKKLLPGTAENCFGFPGVANDEGLLVVDVPESNVKNEMKRTPNAMIPKDLYYKRLEMDREFQASMEE